MLREPQQQAQGQDGQAGRRAGAPQGGSGSSERGGMGAEQSTAQGETSFPFPQQSSTHPSPPPSPSPRASPFCRESTRVPRWQAVSIPGCRRDGASLDVEQPSPLTFERSGTGQRTPSSPLGISPSETLSPQLIRRRAPSDADVLSLAPSIGSVKAYQSSQKAAAATQLRSLLSDSAPATPAATPDLTPAAHKTSRNDYVAQPRPSYRPTRPSPDTSLTSTGSSASSLAYHLLRMRPDHRLLKKKNKPPEHLNKVGPQREQPALSKRSSPFLGPKVVEDTNAPKAIQNDVVGSIAKKRDAPNQLPQVNTSDTRARPLHRVHTVALQALRRPGNPHNEQQRFQSPRPELWHRVSSTGAVAHAIDSRPSTLQSSRPPPPRRRLRFETPQDSQESGGSSSPPPLPRKDRPSDPSIRERLQHDHHRFHAMTPPVQELNAESYFNMIAPATIGMKEFVPAQAQLLGDETAHLASPAFREAIVSPSHGNEDPLTSSQEPHPPNPPPVGSARKNKRGSIFNLLRRGTLKHGPLELSNMNILNSSSAKSQSVQPVTPSITIESADGHDTLNRSESNIFNKLQIPPYFARPRAARDESESTLSPGTSPSTSEIHGREPASPYRLRPRLRHRPSSEQLSPMASSRARPRMRHRHTLEDLKDDADSDMSLPRRSSPSPSPSPGTKATRAVGNVPSAGTEANQSPPLDAPSTDAESAAHQTIEMEPEGQSTLNNENKPGLFTGLMLEMRRLSSAINIREAASSRLKHRLETTTPKLSLTSLRLSRSSMSTRKLSKKSLSTKPLPPLPASDDQRESGFDPAQSKRRITASDLEVTAFEQTPFSKRYADSKWAAQQQIRLLLDESFDNDEEDDDEIVLGFEQDVPDHFPSSPLCPLHPKHKSGGKAICPMHGRYRKRDAGKVVKVGPARSRRAITYVRSGPELRSVTPSGKNKVEIVFDTKVMMDRAIERARSMDQAMEKARQWSMGSDGAIVNPSPPEIREDGEVAKESKVLLWSDKFSFEARGRTRTRVACGSDRTARRRRMRRR